MKLFNQFSILLFAITFLAFSACNNDDDNNPTETPGTISVFLDNKLGDERISMKESGSKDYQLTDQDGQSYNISLFAYYVSEIELLGPNGTQYLDPLNVSPNAEEVTGYYHVISTTPNSNVINLENVEAGTYDKIRFTVGVNESGVQQGAAGGVLDPANGAWFWNWNAGYIGFGVEGSASNSGQEYVDRGNGFETLEGTYAVHVGGWKDVEPAPGEDKKFVNNIKVIELDFDSAISIKEGLTPQVHINVDFAEILKGIDFSTTYSVHRPDLGKPFAEKLINVFELDHVHQ
ncbi:MAG: MbnP family protein [Bacteroidota bacterium]